MAWHIYEPAAVHGERVQAWGGAENHMVVLSDADLGAAADAAVTRLWLGGTTLHGHLVVLTVGDAADEFVERGHAPWA